MILARYKIIVDENGLVKAIVPRGAYIAVVTEDGEFEDTIGISVVAVSHCCEGESDPYNPYKPVVNNAI